MKMIAWCETDKGLKRDSNQDSFLIEQDLGLYVVADGMGGHSGGEVASSMAVHLVRESIAKDLRPDMSSHQIRDLIRISYEHATQKIYERAQQDKQLQGMGTTMVLGLKVGNSLFLANVGDSRIYLYRKPHLWQISEDHSLVNEQIRAGMIREDQARQFAGRNVITRSVGYEPHVTVDIWERPLRVGDYFLLCSDGLSSLAPDNEIVATLNQSAAPDVPHRCIQLALRNGGDDNVTVLFAGVQ